MTDIDRIIHEPVRLRILSILTGVDLADFKFLLSTMGLSKGRSSIATQEYRTDRTVESLFTETSGR